MVRRKYDNAYAARIKIKPEAIINLRYFMFLNFGITLLIIIYTIGGMGVVANW